MKIWTRKQEERSTPKALREMGTSVCDMYRTGFEGSLHEATTRLAAAQTPVSMSEEERMIALASRPARGVGEPSVIRQRRVPLWACAANAERRTMESDARLESLLNAFAAAA